eukprot:2686215-Rhodomonas_salina.1
MMYTLAEVPNRVGPGVSRIVWKLHPLAQVGAYHGARVYGYLVLGYPGTRVGFLGKEIRFPRSSPASSSTGSSSTSGGTS